MLEILPIPGLLEEYADDTIFTELIGILEGVIDHERYTLFCTYH
jgi:hypothetical protein